MSADKMFWTSDKPAQRTPYIIGMYYTVLSSMFGTCNMVHTVKKFCGSACVNSISLLGNGSVKIFSRQQRNVGGNFFSMRPASYQRKLDDWFLFYDIFI
jgi:hypothetical protein